MRFWDSEIGKIIGHGIHDHSRGLAHIDVCINVLKKKIGNSENVTVEDLNMLKR